MGYIRHHTIVVTAYGFAKRFDEIHAEAVRIFGEQASDVVRSNYGGYKSFFIAPDGSKEGWPESERGDERREEFKNLLRSAAYEDGSTAIGWVEVQFNDDEHHTFVTDDSDANWRKESEYYV